MLSTLTPPSISSQIGWPPAATCASIRRRTSRSLGSAEPMKPWPPNPGFGGQSFIPGALPKLALARSRIEAAQQRTGRPILLEVDGGVKADNIAAIARAGADTFVAGSAIFGAADYRATIGEMRAAVAAAQ